MATRKADGGPTQLHFQPQNRPIFLADDSIDGSEREKSALETIKDQTRLSVGSVAALGAEIVAVDGDSKGAGHGDC